MNLHPPSRYGRLKAFRVRAHAQHREAHARLDAERRPVRRREAEGAHARRREAERSDTQRRGAEQERARSRRRATGRRARGRNVSGPVTSDAAELAQAPGALRRAAVAVSRPDTKATLLDRAERLFATHGFEAASLREITSAARANLSAVNYHFRSKKDLIVAVLRRRIRPLNERRLSMLARFQSHSPRKPLPIERVLEALFRPPLQLVAEKDQAGEYFVRLLVHCFADSGAFLRPLIEEELRERNCQFQAAIKHALPYLTTDEVQWRLHFADGVFLHTIANAHVLEIASGGRCRLENVEKVLERLIAFCSAGFEPQRGKGKRKQ